MFTYHVSRRKGRKRGGGAIFKSAQTDFDYDDKVKSSGADDDDEGGVNILKDQDGVVMIGHNEENKQINRQTDKQIKRQTDKTDKQTNRQTDLLTKAASISSRRRIVLRGKSATRACSEPSVMSGSAKL